MLRQVSVRHSFNAGAEESLSNSLNLKFCNVFVYVQVAPFATVVEITSMASKCVLKRSKKKVKDAVGLNLDEQDGCGSTAVENQFVPTKRPRRNYSEPVNFERLMRGEFDKVEHEKFVFVNIYMYICMLK